MIGRFRKAAEVALPPMMKPPAVIAPVKPTRVLIASHSHPALSKGGAEIAAYEIYQSLNQDPHCEAWFLGCQRGNGAERLGSPFTQPFSEREYVYSCGEFDWFNFANRDARFPSEFKSLLETIRPDVVHFHHYVNFGVEAFKIVRDTLPEAKIIVTLHEFLAICHHFGQMITKPMRQLCRKSGTIPCSKCYPEIGQSGFFLRKLYIERFFRLVDHFISPSAFLADRYVDWGVDQSRISVIENIIAEPAGSRALLEEERGDGPLRLGFFGQVSALKGIKVFLEAAEILHKADEGGVEFVIFGDHRNQPPEFQTEFLEALAKAGSNVQFNGPYDPTEVDGLMQSVDLVAVPSIWWENSPVVIQEAFRNRRPVVCSNIGGMAEKVRNGKDGFHFIAGSAISLANLLRKLVISPEIFHEVSKTIRLVGGADAVLLEHKRIFGIS